ncbi:LOW QUALITY PROTEIN: hypothetical protein PHMEG_00023058 [Phytophthora megakarya]|uniref:Eukaryotic/viral aspartic protease n=1 Tax=Phytophthora megakarya TaxID=4795 RepID=A0A225VHX6_9STRA|nr:LOW QUALITY PROTEIN: hypothetical protein PHMEG_00023058 [Phytophthora megakarya]
MENAETMTTDTPMVAQSMMMQWKKNETRSQQQTTSNAMQLRKGCLPGLTTVVPKVTVASTTTSVTHTRTVMTDNSMDHVQRSEDWLSPYATATSRCKQVYDDGKYEDFTELTSLLRVKVDKKDLTPMLQRVVLGVKIFRTSFERRNCCQARDQGGGHPNDTTNDSDGCGGSHSSEDSGANVSLISAMYAKRLGTGP